MKNRRLLTTAQAADRLFVTPHSLENRRFRGGGPPFIKFGGTVRYCADALEAWILERTATKTPGRPRTHPAAPAPTAEGDDREAGPC